MSVGAAPVTNHSANNTTQLPPRYKCSWRGITAEVAELHGPGPYLAAHSSNTPMLVAALEEIGGRLETRLSPDRPTQLQRSRANHLSFVPSGTPIWEFAGQFNYIRRIIVEFDVQLLRSSDEKSSNFQFESAAPLRFSSTSLRILAELLADECARPQNEDRMYGDSLGRVLYHNLMRHADAEQTGQKSRGLTPRQLRNVTERMKHSSCGSIHVQDLARIIGVSHAHFSRAFKSSTGMSPLRWHRMERIQRAQQMLIETEQSLVDIALATGFSDQSHFTRVFHDVVGESPGAWRRSRKVQSAIARSEDFAGRIRNRSVI